MREPSTRVLHTDAFREPPERRAAGEFAVATPPKRRLKFAVEELEGGRTLLTLLDWRYSKGRPK